MTGPSCPWPHASVAGAMRAISRVSHTFAWRGHDVHRHRIMGMTLPSCPRHHAPTIHRSCMSVLRKKSGSGARRSARERAGASAPLARFRGHRRGNKLRGNSIPHAPSPTSNDARSHDPHRNATVTAPHRPETPPARRPRTSTRGAGTATHAEDRMIMIGSLLSSGMALVAVVLAVGSHLPPFPPCA